MYLIKALNFEIVSVERRHSCLRFGRENEKFGSNSSEDLRFPNCQKEHTVRYKIQVINYAKS